MTERTYPRPKDLHDYIDLLDMLEPSEIISGLPRVHVVVDGDVIRISKSDATDVELDAIHRRCNDRVRLLHSNEFSRPVGVSVNQHYDDVVAVITRDHAEKLSVAKTIAAVNFWTEFETDLTDVASWCEDKHGIESLSIYVEQHISSDHYCDLSICNDNRVQPRDLRVAVRDDAKAAMEALGYRYDYRPGFDISDRVLNSRTHEMSAHERLKAVARIEAALT